MSASSLISFFDRRHLEMTSETTKDLLDMSLDSIIKQRRGSSSTAKNQRKQESVGAKGGSRRDGGGDKRKKQRGENRGRTRNDGVREGRSHRRREDGRHRRKNGRERRMHAGRNSKIARNRHRPRRTTQPRSVKMAIFCGNDKIIVQNGTTHVFKLKRSGEIVLNTDGNLSKANRVVLNVVLNALGLNVDMTTRSEKDPSWVLTNGQGWQVPYEDGMQVAASSRSESFMRWKALFYPYKLGGRDATNPVIVDVPLVAPSTGKASSDRTDATHRRRKRPY